MENWRELRDRAFADLKAGKIVITTKDIKNFSYNRLPKFGEWVEGAKHTTIRMALHSKYGIYANTKRPTKKIIDEFMLYHFAETFGIK